MKVMRMILLLGFAFGVRATVMGQSGSLRRPGGPTTYGTANVSYIEVPAIAFFPLDSLTAYSTDFNGGARWSTNCDGVCLSAPLQLPAGAKVISLELDFIDTNAAAGVVGSLVECTSAGQGCTNHPAAGAGPPDCPIPGYICSGLAFAGGAGSQTADLTPDGVTVDNTVSSYRLLAGGNATDGSNKVGGMIVGYLLQVSPPPATADFADVPTNHQFFQFVEALYHSGITAGCGGGNYCPDAPLTRGQMAVFLAKALGLQWP